MSEIVLKHDADHPEQPHSASSTVFKRFQRIYLIGRLLASVGETLPNAYRYAFYSNYGFNRSTIEIFSLIGYGSSLVLGNFSSALADHYGRRLICLLAGFFLIINCLLLNFPLLWIMVIASICWGMSDALYDVGFESWLIQEHRDRLLDLSSLKRLLRDTSFGISLTIVLGGFLAQLLVYMGGMRIPFIVAILFWISAMVFLRYFWTENYGSKETKMTTTFSVAFRVLRSDPRIVLLGFAAAFHDASSHVFMIEWTPTLQRAQGNNSEHALPLGIILAFFNIFNIIGSLLFYPLVQRIRPQSYVIPLFILSAIGMLFPILAPNSLPLICTGFFLFKLCYGVFHPSFSLLRSLYIPDEVRATMMSYIRVPQLIFMCIILLGHFSLTTVFILCAVCNVCGALCAVALRGLKLPEEPAHITEAFVLLDEPSSPSFHTKQPQLEISTTERSIP